MFEKLPFEQLPERATEKEKKRELTPEEIREKLKNPSYLPSREEIFKAFSRKRPKGMDESKWSDEKEKAYLEWFRFWNNPEDPVFELWNKEYIENFSDYLKKRAEDFKATKEKPLQILEVGAGNGKLTHFLKEQFEKNKIENIEIRATDSGKLMKSIEAAGVKIKSHFPVEILDYKKAIEKYKPDVIICSWMPYEQDWTRDFRAAKSVKEYILIGEADGGCCGHPWKTWGAEPEYCPSQPEEILEEISEGEIGEKEKELLLKIKKLQERQRMIMSKGEDRLTEKDEKILDNLDYRIDQLAEKLAKERLKKEIPYKKDGFERYDLDELSKYQICRTDEVNEGRAFHSSTVSFRREVPEK